MGLHPGEEARAEAESLSCQRNHTSSFPGALPCLSLVSENKTVMDRKEQLHDWRSPPSRDRNGSCSVSHLDLDIRGQLGWYGLEEAKLSVSTWSSRGHVLLCGPGTTLVLFPASLLSWPLSLCPGCHALGLFLSLNHSGATAASPSSQQTLCTSLRLSLLPASLRLSPELLDSFHPPIKLLDAVHPLVTGYGVSVCGTSLLEHHPI